jgi:hypothetical protein
MNTFLALVGALSLNAGTIAYSDPAGQGTQAWGGNLALNFNVNSPIVITELGVFNTPGSPTTGAQIQGAPAASPLGSGFITGPIQVVIYDSTGTQVTPIVTFAGSYGLGGLGYDVFQAIAPVVLAPGSYQVDAVGFSANDLNGNLNTGSSSGPLLNDGGGLLTFTGAAWDSSTVLDNPGGCPTCQAAPIPQNSQFDAGTFQYSAVTPVPEPATFALFGCGLIAVSAALRRRRVR